jgi:hypothetical protein
MLAPANALDTAHIESTKRIKMMNSTALYKKVMVLAATVVSLNAGSGAFAQSPNAVPSNYLQKQIQQEIGPFIDSLSLPSSVTSGITAFLLERAEAAANASALGSQQNLSPTQVANLIAAARANVDAGITSSFDAPTAGLVQEIVRNYVGYSQIDQIYAPQMAAQGFPLTPSQIRQLANTLYNCNSALVTPNSPQMRSAVNIASGLSQLDDLVLSQTASYLSASQQVILRVNLAAISKSIISGTSFSY